MGNFEVEYDGKYFVLMCQEENCIPYQLKMLLGEKNQFQYLLPVKKQMKDTKTYLYYDRTSHISLQQAVQTKKMTAKQFLQFLIKLWEAMEELENYQLVDKGVLLTVDTIYVNPAILEPKFLYAPFETEEYTIEELQSIIRNWIGSNLVEMTKETTLLQQITDIVNQPILDKKTFFMKLKTLQQQPTHRVQYTREVVPTEIKEQCLDVLFQVEEKQLPQRPKKVSPIPITPVKEEKIVPEKKKKETAETKAVNKKLVIGGIDFILLLGCYQLYTMGFLYDQEGKFDVMTVAVLFFVIGAIDFLLLRKLKTKTGMAKENKKVNKKESKKEKRKKKKNPFAVEEEIPTPFFIEELSNVKTDMPSSQIVETAISYDSMDEEKTMLLEQDEERKAYVKMADGKEIYFQKDSLRVGKSKNHVDVYLKNPMVSKVHADILQKQNQFFVIDLNSLNGTYLNGEKTRIESNIEYPLQNNDIIRFANEEITIHFF